MQLNFNHRPLFFSAQVLLLCGCATAARGLPPDIAQTSDTVLTSAPPKQSLSQIKVSQSAWVALTPFEREYIQRSHIVDLAELDSFGVIIDNQGVNESTPGTTGGANLGGAIGNAAYIDNAIKGGNYSAKNQLAAGILGAILGSSLDSRPNAQYHFRYAVKLGNGNIQYFDEVKGDAFRHPAGVCVSVPNIALIDQQLCSQTAIILRATYLPPPPELAGVSTPIPPPPTSLNTLIANVEPKAATPIQVGDTVLVSNGAINGYQAPSISAKRLKELPNGTPFEVVVLMKDFVKVRDTAGQLLWVERRGVAGAPLSITPVVQNKPSLPPPSPVAQTVSATVDTLPVQVNCKLGTLAPVRTTAEKCELIKGSQVQ